MLGRRGSLLGLGGFAWVLWPVGLALSAASGPPARAAATDESDRRADASTMMQRQRIAQMFQEKLPDARPEATEQAAADFLDHMRQTSPIAADNIASGRMDEDELKSRVEVYLRDHPELSGKTPDAALESPRARVAELLRGEEGVGRTDPERMVIADRFIQRLGELSSAARDNLLAGKMTTDELQSRVRVFAADLRAESAAVAVDPAVAAALPIVDSFVKANFGSAAERPDSICFKGVEEGLGKKREFVIFKKRPNKIRIHIMENDQVIGIIGFDGTRTWRQSSGQPAIPVVGSDADAIVNSTRFDHPLIGYRENGTAVRLDGGKAGRTIQLHLRESDGTEMLSTIDPSNYREISRRTLRPGGVWTELRFKDYRKVGPVNLPYEQEVWGDGKLTSTTRISDVNLDPGLLDGFFAMPTGIRLGFMDYMNALAIAARERRGAAPSAQSQKASP